MTRATDAKAGFCPDKYVPRPHASLLTGPGVVGALPHPRLPELRALVHRKASKRGRQRWGGGLFRQGALVKTMKE